MIISKAKYLTSVYMKANVPTMLWGPPGIGKSDIVRQLAKADDVPLIDFRAIIRDAVDLRGVPAIDVVNNMARWLPPSDLPNEKLHGASGIFFMDELPQAAPSVQAACFGLILDRKVGEYEMPPGWRIIAAGNRTSDRAGANRMLTPLLNRLAHVDIDASIPDFVHYGMSTGRIHPLVMGFVRFRGETALHNMDLKTDDLRAFPTPRSWERFSDVLHQLDLRTSVAKDTKSDGSVRTDDEGKSIPVGVMMDAGSGIVGQAGAGEFCSFVLTYNDLPPFEAIMRDPSGTKIPTEPSAQYALGSMLSGKITPKQVEQGYTYVRRLGPEFGQMFMFDITDRGDEFCNNKTYVDWASKNLMKSTNVGGR